jgi:hypothetical protein
VGQNLVTTCIRKLTTTSCYFQPGRQTVLMRHSHGARALARRIKWASNKKEQGSETCYTKSHETRVVMRVILKGTRCKLLGCSRPSMAFAPIDTIATEGNCCKNTLSRQTHPSSAGPRQTRHSSSSSSSSSSKTT